MCQTILNNIYLFVASLHIGQGVLLYIKSTGVMTANFELVRVWKEAKFFKLNLKITLYQHKWRKMIRYCLYDLFFYNRNINVFNNLLL